MMFKSVPTGDPIPTSRFSCATSCSLPAQGVRLAAFIDDVQNIRVAVEIAAPESRVSSATCRTFGLISKDAATAKTS